MRVGQRTKAFSVRYSANNRFLSIGNYCNRRRRAFDFLRSRFSFSSLSSVGLVL